MASRPMDQRQFYVEFNPPFPGRCVAFPTLGWPGLGFQYNCMICLSPSTHSKVLTTVILHRQQGDHRRGSILPDTH